MMLLTWYFDKKLSSKKIEKALDEIIGNVRIERQELRDGKIVVSCAQRTAESSKSVKEYIASLNRFVKEASCAGASIIAFPEYNFFSLLGLIPGFTAANKVITRITKKQLAKGNTQQNFDEKDGNMEKESSDGPNGMGKFFIAISRPVENAVRTISSKLAASYGIYLYSGSYMAYEDGFLYNKGCLYGPDGECVGSQKKMHLMDTELSMGIARGNELQVFELPFAKIAFPVCMDASYFESFNLAVKNGAELVIIPISDDDDNYGTYKAMRGIWARVQESYVVGIKASQNGWIAGMHFTGKAGVFAPLEMTPEKDGVLAISGEPEGNGLISAEIDIAELHRARENAMYYGDVNPDFEEKYIENTYFRKR